MSRVVLSGMTFRFQTFERLCADGKEPTKAGRAGVGCGCGASEVPVSSGKLLNIYILAALEACQYLHR